MSSEDDRFDDAIATAVAQERAHGFGSWPHKAAMWNVLEAAPQGMLVRDIRERVIAAGGGAGPMSDAQSLQPLHEALRQSVYRYGVAWRKVGVAEGRGDQAEVERLTALAEQQSVPVHLLLNRVPKDLMAPDDGDAH